MVGSRGRETVLLLGLDKASLKKSHWSIDPNKMRENHGKL